MEEIMARAIWTGAITFGLVTVPVGLFSATRDHSVHFHQFQRGTADRVRNKRVNERTGDEVDYDEIVKGREVDDGDLVMVEPDELDEIAPGRSRTIDIRTFVDLDEIDPIFFQKTYWLAPADPAFAPAYELLRKAMAETNRAGIATFVMRGKEYLAAIRADDDMLVLETLFFADEIRDPAEELDDLPGRKKAEREQMKMATALIQAMSGPWKPDEYRDTYTERVEKLIEDKRKGNQVVTEAAPPGATEVVDLMEALGRSVEAAKKNKSKKDLSALPKSDLDSIARDLGIRGRSKMNRTDLADAIRQAS
jgi:DNA end-binding protein Ku